MNDDSTPRRGLPAGAGPADVDELPQPGRAAPARDAAAATSAPSRRLFGKPWTLRIAILGAVIATVGASLLLWPTAGEILNAAKPLPQGAMIELPDNADPGLPIDQVADQFGPADGEDDTSPDGSYVDPRDPATYRRVADDGTVTYTVPVDGPCPVESSGAIGAPANYRHACYHREGGAVVYTTHAVRGGRVGGFENIGLLRAGQVVHLDGQAWRVTDVETFPMKQTPAYVFQPGRVVLLTCHIDAAVESGAPFSFNDVAVLEKVT